jgi:hypothetical protein
MLMFTLQEVEVNVDNYQILHLRPGLKVSVNDKPVQLGNKEVAEVVDEAGTLVLQLEAGDMPEGLISVNIPGHGIHIIYTGSSTLIMVS